MIRNWFENEWTIRSQIFNANQTIDLRRRVAPIIFQVWHISTWNRKSTIPAKNSKLEKNILESRLGVGGLKASAADLHPTFPWLPLPLPSPRRIPDWDNENVQGQVEGVDAKLSLIQPIIFRRYNNNLEKSKVLSSVKVHFATDCDKKLQRCKRVFQRYIHDGFQDR